jgi:Protein of unknown function (DUF3365)
MFRSTDATGPNWPIDDRSPRVDEPNARFALRLAAITGALALTACATPQPLPAVDEAALATEADLLAARFQQELGHQLTAAMARGGPVAAVDTCRVEAPRVAAQLATASGWSVRRVGTRVRNPATGAPDGWERAQLGRFAASLASPAGTGSGASGLTALTVERGRGAPRFRYMKAIVTAPQCLACHGARSAQSAELRAALGRNYPQDSALDYSAGELRGAFSLTRPLPVGPAAR